MVDTSILRKIGFSKTTFSETIITIDCSRELYSTPIGLKLADDMLVARVYKNTRLHRVIIQIDQCSYCICITTNSQLFYRSVFERNILKYRNYYGVECIDKCDAYVIATPSSVIDKNEYSLVFFKPINIIVVNKYSRAMRRVDYAIIEALVYYTKIPYVDPSSRRDLLVRIEWCREIVYRSSNNIKYRRIVDNILSKTRSSL